MSLKPRMYRCLRVGSCGIASKPTVTSRLLVEVKDVAVALLVTQGAVYVKKSDDLIIKQIIATAKVTGLLSGKITKTQPKHAHIVQHYCTDWDFIVSRAEAGPVGSR